MASATAKAACRTGADSGTKKESKAAGRSFGMAIEELEGGGRNCGGV
jgi:hypothetical protein